MTQLHLSLTSETKRNLLKALTEDEFRDRVVCPLFKAQGYLDYRELCGPEEEGKDCTFIKFDAFREITLVAIQTKATNITFAANSEKNIGVVMSQIETMSRTMISIPSHGQRLPDKIYFITSGTISNNVRTQLAEYENKGVSIWDRDKVISLIDEKMVGFWEDLLPENREYYVRLIEYIKSLPDVIGKSTREGKERIPFLDEHFVAVALYQFKQQPVIKKGQSVKFELRVKETKDPHKLLASEKRVLITGSSGVGKTTYLRRLAFLVAQDRSSNEEDKTFGIPVLLSAKSIRTEQIDLMGEVKQSIQRICPTFDIESKYGKQSLEKVLLFVDGIDEVTSMECRSTILSALVALAEAQPQYRIIVASRERQDVYDLLLEQGFAHYRLEHIGLKSALSLADRVLAGRKTDASCLKETLRVLHDVHGMKLSPLLVTMFAEDPQFSIKDVAPNLFHIFEKYVGLMLGQWDKSKGLSSTYEWRMVEHLLSVVAFEMHQKRIVSLPNSEFRKLFLVEAGQIGLANAEDTLTELLTRSELITDSEGSIRFAHLMLQEYFASKSVSGFTNFNELIGDEWWRNVVIFYFGRNSSQVTELGLLYDVLPVGSAEKFNSVVTLSMGLQSLITSPEGERVQLLKRSVVHLAELLDQFQKSDEAKPTWLPFIYFVLLGRLAVATKLISKVTSEADWLGDHELKEHMAFWIGLGDLESGSNECIELIVDENLISSDQLKVGLFLSSMFIANVKVCSKEEKEIAGKVAASLGIGLKHILTEVRKEINSYLLEVQGGKVTSLSKIEEGEESLFDADE